MRAALEIRAEAGAAEHDREVLRVRRNRRPVAAQALEQLDALVELAMAMGIGQHQHEQLGGGVVIDDRRRDVQQIAAVELQRVERARRIVGVQARGPDRDR